MPRILFVNLHRPNRSPSQRYRYEQYIPFLEENGFQCETSYIISEKDDKIFYGAGNYFGKFKILLKSHWHRWQELKHSKDYDIIFVQREAFMTGTWLYEKKYAQSTAKLVFDFDDAIWIPQISTGNKRLSFLKNFDKTQEIIRLSDLVIAGNEYLANYARQFNPNTAIIPTTVDTDEHHRLDFPNKPKDKICIGWSGSFSTLPHFETAEPALKIIQDKYPNKVYFKIMGDGTYYNESLQTQGIAWKKETEVQELSEIDIGIMPLPDDEWAKGKCGMKSLLYMAVEATSVISPVGVNTEIIQDGENGFLASTTEEWVAKLSELIENPEHIPKFGKKGRETVIERYSVLSQREKYVEMLKNLIE